MTDKQQSNKAAIEVRPNHALEPELAKRFSSDEEFLNRVETLRLSQEWAHDLDMRQYVSHPCKRYRYRRRSYWLDAQSRELFLEGLKRDGGLFTCATYEAIRAAAPSRADPNPADPPQTKMVAPAKLEASKASSDTAPRQLHEVFKLGYFEDRRKDRIKYSTRVLLIGDGPISPGRTRDISETGIQIRTSSSGNLRVGDIVKVKFPNIPGAEKARIPYRVVRIVRKLNELFVSLHCVDKGSTSIPALVRGLIKQQDDEGQGPLQIDLEDASLTAESLLAERHYMYSTSLIPFFLAREGKHDIRLTVACYNEANEKSLLSFQDQAGGNRLMEAINRRHLHHVKKLAKVDGQILAMLAVWRATTGGGLETLMDLECRTDTDWYASLARHRHAKEFQVFAVVVRRARRPNVRRLSREIEPLAAKLPSDARQLLREGSRIVAVGTLVDFTSEVRGWHLAPYESAVTKGAAPHGENPPLRGGGKPEVLPVQYLERTRSHSRYLLQVHVTLQMQGKRIDAVTQDISLTGMSVLLPAGTQAVASGTSVRVTLSGVAEQAGVLARLKKSLEDVSYRVVSTSTDAHKKIQLRLRLQEIDRHRGFTRALFTFLQKQQSMLHIERSHSVEAAASRLYSSFFVAVSAALPVFYFRATADGSTFARVGLTHKPSPLAAFFETADGRFDYSSLTQPGWISRLQHEMKQSGRAEITAFLVKDRVADQFRYKITAVADFEFADRAERDEFLDYAVGRDFRAVKILMSPPCVPPAPELALALKRFEQYSPGRAARLREDFEHLTAVGDVLDITTSFHELRYTAPRGNSE